MNTEKKREQFEAWALARFINSDTMKPLQRSADKPDEYHYPVLNTAWAAWQASREALVIELPKIQFIQSSEEFQQSCLKIRYCDIAAIEAAGLKVRP
ncbi:hypothetical protein ALO43_03342 [Pseudomonas tremae]|uniref:Uncharacterized protein n=1 Tax=Pseudomonas tremae TaxID=200454 RepID=A0AA40NZV3_9PSED|nr:MULTISPECIES: hypothetical protein [Pseudomonas syringae group]KPY92167.1 hypothetical protein ALO43_03342 [Pseudomonas tremae]RMO03082.1 hypothetical protein ALQ48_03918 [Pseudomonas coronafaciens pv. zizaniae]